MSLLDRLHLEMADDDSGEEVYDLYEIRRQAMRCIQLGDGELAGVLAVNIIVDLYVDFIVFRCHSGAATKDGVEVDGPKMQIVFRGEGPSGSLRELRHTWWGDDESYLPSIRPDEIIPAFEALKEWFDL
jgi:hypothetical protein